MCAAPLYELRGVGKDYDGPAELLTVINNLDLVIEQGEALAITGASGSGKVLSCIYWGPLIFLRGANCFLMVEIFRNSLMTRRLLYEIEKSDLCFSFIICCRNFQLLKTSLCKQ